MPHVSIDKPEMNSTPSLSIRLLRLNHFLWKGIVKITFWEHNSWFIPTTSLGYHPIKNSKPPLIALYHFTCSKLLLNCVYFPLNSQMTESMFQLQPYQCGRLYLVHAQHYRIETEPGIKWYGRALLLLLFDLTLSEDSFKMWCRFIFW